MCKMLFFPKQFAYGGASSSQEIRLKRAPLIIVFQHRDGGAPVCRGWHLEAEKLAEVLQNSQTPICPKKGLKFSRMGSG